MTTTARVLGDNLVIVTNNPGQLRAVFPVVKEAVVRGQSVVAVPYTLEAVRVLANLGISAPSPIRTKYDWPGRFQPRWYQVDTADFFTLNRRGHCHNAPRTGKTLSALWAADYLKRTKRIKSTLIVAPLSTLWDVWEQNIFEHFPLRTFATLHGSRQKRLDLLARPHDFYIINHHGLGIVEEALAERPDIDLVIVDEVACFRNSRAKTLFKPLNEILNRQGIDRGAWGLTGTPTPQEPTDAYGQCKLITPQNYRGHFTTFKNETMYQLNQFKWVPRRGHEQTVAKVLSPSIRFERSVCTDLEPCFIERRAELSTEQHQHYKALLAHAVTDVRGSAVTAVNAAVLIQKIVQTACIVEDTPVLSNRGWVPIQSVLPTDLLWDGAEWVHHGGVVFNGVRPVVQCGGIALTCDHQMLTRDGWKTAQEILDGEKSGRTDWVNVRIPHGHSARGFCSSRSVPARSVAVSMHLRERGDSDRDELDEEGTPQCEALRLSAGGSRNNSRDDEQPPISDLDPHGSAVPLREVSRLGKLRGAWNNSMRRVARLLRSFLGRHARRVLRSTDVGAYKERLRIRCQQLSVGDPHGTKQQQTLECLYQNSEGYDDSRTGRKDVGAEHCDTPRSNISIPLADGQSSRTSPSLRKQAVYDILNCGPRNRFVVRGTGGELRIVHNCGVVYGIDGEFLKIDFGPRLKVLEEMIEENDEKVLVFVPFTGALEAVAQALRKRWSVETIDGNVSPGKRLQIFRDFRSTKDPHVLVCHPGTMAHGLDLTAASLSIWYAPFWRAEIYQQANARTDGSKQTAKIDIAHIYATPEEHRIYQVLKEKGRLQDAVLDLLKEGR